MEIIQNQAEYTGETFSDYDFSELSLSKTRFQQCSFKGSAMSSFSTFHEKDLHVHAYRIYAPPYIITYSIYFVIYFTF